MNVLRSVSISLAAALIGEPVIAHHSFAMFDMAVHATVAGTIAKVEWVNPHLWVWMYVPNSIRASGYDLYSFEGPAINLLIRSGWKKESLQVGEKVTVEYNPLKDGRTGGFIIKATHADGTVSKAYD